jgi:cytidyltransferase-like protein
MSAPTEPPGHRPVWIYADVVCDLFHPGHLAFFRHARALGDRLVVGLVSDADVASYKPPPIMSFHERLAMVRACRLVDRALDAPAPLHCTCDFLDAIGADFGCHGDDMDPAELTFWYGDIQRAGRLKTVPYSGDVSSRLVIKRVIARFQAGTLRPE